MKKAASILTAMVLMVSLTAVGSLASESKGSWTKANEKGSAAKGSEMKGSEMKGSEMKGSEMKGSEMKGSEAKPAAAPTGTGTLEVAEIAIAKDVQEREAVEVGDTFVAGIERLYCWTKITGAVEGDSVVHRWKKGEEIMAEITLNVNASPWRTFSSKAIMADWTGDWVVEILQGDTVLKSKAFVIQ